MHINDSSYIKFYKDMVKKTKLRMVPGAGLEPARCCHRGILSPLRLPIPPPGHGCNMEAEVGIEPASAALQAAA